MMVFYFASEINTLFLMLGKNCNININHICSYIVEGYISVYNEKKTFFTKIEGIISV